MLVDEDEACKVTTTLMVSFSFNITKYTKNKFTITLKARVSVSELERVIEAE